MSDFTPIDGWPRMVHYGQRTPNPAVTCCGGNDCRPDGHRGSCSFREYQQHMAGEHGLCDGPCSDLPEYLYSDPPTVYLSPADVPRSEAPQRPTCDLCGHEAAIGGLQTEPLIQVDGRPARVCRDWHGQEDRRNGMSWEGCRARMRARLADVQAAHVERRQMEHQEMLFGA